MPFRTEIHIKLKESYKIKKWKRLDIQALKVQAATNFEPVIETPVRAVKKYRTPREDDDYDEQIKNLPCRCPNNKDKNHSHSKEMQELGIYEDLNSTVLTLDQTAIITSKCVKHNPAL